MFVSMQYYKLLFIYSHKRTILQFDWFPRRILSANITFPQYYATLSRQVTVKSEVQSPKLVSKFPLNRFACFQAIFLCRSNADVLIRLNVHVRSVIRKTLKQLWVMTHSVQSFDKLIYYHHLNTVMFSAE